METNGYALPENVWLSEGRVFWQPMDVWQPVRYPEAKVTPETFQRFLNLNSASDDEILAFAQEYGPITAFSREVDIRARLAEEKRVGETVGETTDEWRRLARVAAAILQISKDHRDGKTAKPEHWAVLDADAGMGSRPMLDKKRSREFEMVLVAAEVNRWVKLGGVAPLLNIVDNEFKVVLEAFKLRGGLAIQLLQQIGGTQLAACSGCHQFYFPVRAPRVGQDNFCKICFDAGVPVARAKHRQYLRKLEKQKQSKSKKRKEGN
jgi:hypothetical protein